MEKYRRLELLVIAVFELVFLALGIQAVLINDIPRFYNTLVAMVLILIPVLVEKAKDVRLPFGLKSLVPLSIFFHLAGGIMSWYWIYPPYGYLAHVVSGMAVAMVVFTFFVFLDYYGMRTSRPGVLLGTLVITMCFGAIWDMGEIIIDVMFSTSYSNGVWDTGGDIISDIIGVLILLWIVNRYMEAIPEGEGLGYLLRRS